MPFLYGFIAASMLFSIAAFLYYRRALKRVRSIEAAIHRHEESKAVVGAALDKVFAAKPSRRGSA